MAGEIILAARRLLSTRCLEPKSNNHRRNTIQRKRLDFELQEQFEQKETHLITTTQEEREEPNRGHVLPITRDNWELNVVVARSIVADVNPYFHNGSTQPQLKEVGAALEE
ncbi:hypothetical protein Pcac1_g1073 [Phytophthora cactorum]|nr:hypothetical protein Pcac1_g1073 [Phytophthora cactorum]KAG2824061.1 hypothetical protein PC111_g9981 [Phytophthora cactorum]